MFPIRDHNPSSRTPYVTLALIAINVVVFLSYFTMLEDPLRIAPFFSRWALIPAMAGDNPMAFITSQFLHGGLMHLGGNMLFLWIFGDNLEDEMGHIPFLGFYLLSGVAAAYAQYIADPTSMVPMVGASGAIAGVMGGYLLLFPKARVDVLLILIIIFKVFPVPAWIMLMVWFALQIFNGIGAQALEGGGVAYWAHAGGFIAGLLLTVPVFLRRGGTSFWNATEGHPPHPPAQYRRTRVPQVRR